MSEEHRMKGKRYYIMALNYSGLFHDISHFFSLLACMAV